MGSSSTNMAYVIPLCWLICVGCSGNKEIEQLATDLQDNTRETRYEAAKQIEERVEQGADASMAVSALASALSDEDAKVRYRAAKSLAKLGHSASGAVTELRQALAEYRNQWRIQPIQQLSCRSYGCARGSSCLPSKGSRVRHRRRTSETDEGSEVVRLVGSLGSTALVGIRLVFSL